MTSETSAADRKYLMLHESDVIIPYSYNVLGMKKLLWTKANCTIGIDNFIGKLCESFLMC